MSSRRVAPIDPFFVMKILARARQLEAEGRDIIHLEIGEPDFSTPQPIIDAGIEALKSGKTHYSPARGIVELRQSIKEYYKQRFHVEIKADQVIITPGASGALLLALGAVVDVNDEVITADPAYPCYRHFVHFLSARPKILTVGEKDNFQLNYKIVKDNWTDSCKAVIIASPSNPTGTLIDVAELKKIHDFVEQRGGVLIVDEIYQELVYGREPYSALADLSNVIIINSFSKYFGMTGWRLGWLVAGLDLIPTVDKLMQNLFLAAPTPAQYAALQAFHPDSVVIMQQRREEFAKRRKFLLSRLDDLGFSVPVEPQGAFYIYASCEKFSSDSEQFAHEILEQVGVAITPGRDFGTHNCKKYLRFAYTTSMQNLAMAMQRLESFLKTH